MVSAHRALLNAGAMCWHHEPGSLHPSCSLHPGWLQTQPRARRRLTKHPEKDLLLFYLPREITMWPEPARRVAAKGQIFGGGGG